MITKHVGHAFMRVCFANPSLQFPRDLDNSAFDKISNGGFTKEKTFPTRKHPNKRYRTKRNI
jgi:hypothetical protein